MPTGSPTTTALPRSWRSARRPDDDVVQPVVAEGVLCERQEGKGSGFTDNDSLAKELAICTPT